MQIPKITAGGATVSEVFTVLEIVRAAVPHLEGGKRPCDYGPWTRALASLGGERSDVNLVDFADEITRARWNGPSRHLIEFAITFLEADVKLFRSGYAARRLIVRLRQSELRVEDVARLDEILRRVVVNGTGLEEFRVYCKLASRLVREGHLHELVPWLHEQALGAVLDVDHLSISAHLRLIDRGALGDTEIARLFKGAFWGRRWGFIYPALTQVVRIKRNDNQPMARSKRNAFAMLEAVQSGVQSHGLGVLPDGSLLGDRSVLGPP